MLPTAGSYGRPKRYPVLLDTLRRLALPLDNLKLCLDASDAVSCRADNLWRDRSGGGFDFNLGANAAADSADPLFNGRPGRGTRNEYFIGDGGDYFSYAAGANDAWMKAMFKAGSCSMFAVIYIPSNTSYKIFSTETSGSPAGFGGGIKYESGKISYVYVNTSASFTTIVDDPDISGSLPGVFAVGISTTLGASTIDIDTNVNGVADGAAGFGVLQPTASDPSAVAKIMASGDAGSIAPVGARIYEIAIWQGTKLTAANLAALWAARRGKYGL